MSEARSLFFLPSFLNLLDASIISTSLVERDLRNTITMVGIPVPKKMSDGKPMIASMLSFSISCWRMLPSEPSPASPRKRTP